MEGERERGTKAEEKNRRKEKTKIMMERQRGADKREKHGGG